jgi:hypothetical protein
MAAVPNQCLPGFNHNVKHAGKSYHVQTEDSGTANPHVITHLFIGGNILSTKKTSYASLVGAEDCAAQVTRLMQAQHKEMLRELVRGAFDAVERERTARARAFAPGQLADAEPPLELELVEAELEPLDVDVDLDEDLAAPAAPSRPAPPPQAAATQHEDAGPPVLPRVPRPGSAPAPTAVPRKADADRRLDELVLSYLAGDAAKRER